MQGFMFVGIIVFRLRLVANLIDSESFTGRDKEDQCDPIYADAEFYGWSEDKARQYWVSERADFGTFIRQKGFSLK